MHVQICRRKRRTDAFKCISLNRLPPGVVCVSGLTIDRVTLHYMKLTRRLSFWIDQIRIHVRIQLVILYSEREGGGERGRESEWERERVENEWGETNDGGTREKNSHEISWILCINIAIVNVNTNLFCIIDKIPSFFKIPQANQNRHDCMQLYTIISAGRPTLLFQIVFADIRYSEINNWPKRLARAFRIKRALSEFKVKARRKPFKSTLETF